MCSITRSEFIRATARAFALAVIVEIVGCTSIGSHSLSDAFPDRKVRELVRASLDHDSKAVAALVKAGVDVNYQGGEGVTPLAWVLTLKDAKAAEELLNAGADSSREINNHAGNTLTVVDLMAGGDSPDLLELLLKHGGNPNSPNSYGEPALTFAADQGRSENIQLLLKYGADINAHGTRMQGAPWYAISSGRYDLAIYLLEEGYSYNLDQIAAIAESRQVPIKSEQCKNRIQLFDFLKEHNIIFPAFPRLHHGQLVFQGNLSDGCLPSWYPKAAAGILE